MHEARVIDAELFNEVRLYLGVALARCYALTQPCIINCKPIKARYNGCVITRSPLWGGSCRGPTLIENYEGTVLGLD